ncbi:MAG: nickel-dependent lactate racemase [Fimbriimonas sp.]
MTVHLDYGRNGLDVELPDANVVGVLSLRNAPHLEDADAAIAEAIAHPIGAKPLRELARGRQNAIIVVCDVTRPVPNPTILPHLLEALNAGGIPDARITILVATGTHRPNLDAELIQMLGPEVVERCRVVNHYCADDASVREIGVSPNGVPVALNTTYLDADLKITVGMIEPHFMAGYAGGRKMVMPGVAAERTIQAWHSPCFLEHPNATMGITRGNPVHEESLAIANMARPDFIVDVALDVQKRICAVFAGDMERAWEAGVEFVSRTVFDYVDAPVDVCVTTCGGHPLDLTFYQTIKGMVGALPIVRPGGTIIVASQMAEGVGNRHFLDALLDIRDIATFTDDIQAPGWRFLGDQWQIEELAKAVRHHRIAVVGEGVPPDLLRRLFVASYPSVEAAVADALRRHGEGARIAVIPKGPYVIPAVRSPQPV